MQEVLDKIKHSIKMREMAQGAYSSICKDEEGVSFIGDIIENLTKTILDLIEVETDKKISLQEQEKILQYILMRVYEDFVLFSKDKSFDDEINFKFEKYGVKLYLIIRDEAISQIFKDKDIEKKIEKERYYFKNLFL